MQQALLEREGAEFFVIDATSVARASGMGGRINTIMQVCFFALSGVLPRDEAIEAIKKSIKKTYGKKGEEVVQMNLKAVDNTLANLFEVPLHRPASTAPADSCRPSRPDAPPFVRDVLGKLAAGRGDDLPVSAFPRDGTFPDRRPRSTRSAISPWKFPVWNEAICIQCLKCVAMCPHATIRAKVCEPAQLEGAPATFKSAAARAPEWKGMRFVLQVAAEDCTGCALCVEVCPARDKTENKRKALNMAAAGAACAWPSARIGISSSACRKWTGARSNTSVLRQQQVMQPLFEFSGACAGCGETPYLKLLTQLFGDRAIIANATGCSSIYGGNLPTTPYAKNCRRPRAGLVQFPV